MSDDLKVQLRVGSTLRLEGPDGNVTAFTVKEITAASGFSPDWTTTTPHSGEITLTLSGEK